MTITLRIFIANLNQYNAGKLIGEWIELPCCEGQLEDALSRISFKKDEYFISDSEDIPFYVNEYDNPSSLNSRLQQYEELETFEKLCVAFLCSEGYEWSYCIENHEDVTVYPKESLQDVAYSLVDDGCFGSVPDCLTNYINYESIARDLECDGYVERAEGVFYYAN